MEVGTIGLQAEIKAAVDKQHDNQASTCTISPIGFRRGLEQHDKLEVDSRPYTLSFLACFSARAKAVEKRSSCVSVLPRYQISISPLPFTD